MDVQLLTLKIVQTLRRDGLRAALRKCINNIKHERSADDFDLRHGTDTGGIEPLWKFKIRSPNACFGSRYEVTQEQELADSVNFLNEDLKDFTFIDLGCGKGRTLLVASQLGFKQMIGVEFVRELVEIARTNVAKMQIPNAVVLHADAADFAFPDSNIVVYLYNPFSQEVLRKVVANMKAGCSKRLYVIYKGSQCTEMFDSWSFLTRFGNPPKAQHIQVWRVVG